MPDLVEALSALAGDRFCRRRVAAWGGRRPGPELDLERLRAELDAWLLVAGLVLLEFRRLLVERDELPLRLPEVATDPSLDWGIPACYPGYRGH